MIILFKNIAYKIILIGLCVKFNTHFKIKVINFISLLKKSKVFFSHEEDTDLFYVSDLDYRKYYFHSLCRGYDLYNSGTISRGNELAKTYFIDAIDFSSDDVVIDCGANYGDLGIFLSDKIKKNCYI